VEKTKVVSLMDRSNYASTLLAKLQCSILTKSLIFTHVFCMLFLLMYFQALFGSLRLPEDVCTLLPEYAGRYLTTI